MMTAVRQTATVSADGRLALDVPDLAPGTVAEVIVLVESTPEQMTPLERVAAWQRLRAQSGLTDEQVQQWLDDIKAERMAWRFPGDDVKP
jgi:hypothetical protein